MEIPVDKKYTNYKFPKFTLSLVGLSIILYLGITLLNNFGPIDEKYYALFGAPYAIDIYRGQFWGVITNSFVHVLFFQLLFNILPIFFFASFIERRLGWFSIFLLGLISSAVTSCIQLAVSDDPGLGLAGVNYCLYSFIFVRSFYDNRFDFKAKYLLLLFMLVILVICQYLNWFEGWNFGIASMLGGIVWGIVCAFPVKPIIRIVQGFILTLSVLSLMYAPWSAEWYCAKGVSYHEAGNLELATSNYKKALEINKEHYLATENLKIVEIDRLSDLAYIAHYHRKYAAARRYYLKILRLDKKNKWAKENLKNLP
jgi:membrane associated rhomboid family serine protease